MKSPTIFYQIIHFSLYLISLMASPCAFGQKKENQRVAFYNLENLFYPEDDSLTKDEEFTPEGMRYWSYYRYHEKSNRMAKSILSIGQWEPPAVVGVAEIENKQVLEDLAQSQVLRKFEYGIIHYESPDRRGIDVGMLYRKNVFTPITSQAIPIKLKSDPQFATRDILYTKGTFNKTDTVHLFFCHWPSRYGGQAQSEPKRIQAALTLKHITDSLQALPYPAYIITAGDFNDEWNNISIKDSLEAAPFDNDTLSGLVNLMASMPQNQGSHRYRGTWSYLDQIIVSANLLHEKSIRISKNTANVVRHDFLLETDDKYPGTVPFRTFLGMKYHGGFSDHLPVYIDLEFKN